MFQLTQQAEEGRGNVECLTRCVFNEKKFSVDVRTDFLDMAVGIWTAYIWPPPRHFGRSLRSLAMVVTHDAIALRNATGSQRLYPVCNCSRSCTLSVCSSGFHPQPTKRELVAKRGHPR